MFAVLVHNLRGFVAHFGAVYSLDDVGGAHGFVDMICIIHGDNEYEADEMREWARGMGWTGRMSRTDRML